MPFLAGIERYLPLIQTGLSAAGTYLGGREQQQGITQAGQISQKATDEATRIILGMYDEGQAALAPYKNVGPAALNRLQSLAYGGNVPAPASVQPPPTTNTLSRFSPQTGTTSGGPAAVQNAMLGNQQAQAQQQRGQNAMLGGLAGGIGVPLAAGLGSAALAGTGAGAGLGLALGTIGGPIGMGLGALGGYLGSKIGANNPYKAAASQGIDEVSRQIWGTNVPGIAPEQLKSGIVHDMLKGVIPVAQGKQLINQNIDAWVNGMRKNGTPENVIESSIRTQMNYLKPLKGVFDKLGTQAPAMIGG